MVPVVMSAVVRGRDPGFGGIELTCVLFRERIEWHGCVYDNIRRAGRLGGWEGCVV